MEEKYLSQEMRWSLKPQSKGDHWLFLLFILFFCPEGQLSMQSCHRNPLNVKCYLDTS